VAIIRNNFRENLGCLGVGDACRLWGEWTLDAFWMPRYATFTLGSLRQGNQGLYGFWERLEAVKRRLTRIYPWLVIFICR
jgi:hypothetical protein